MEKKYEPVSSFPQYTHQIIFSILIDQDQNFLNVQNVVASNSFPKGWNMSTQRHFDNTPGYKGWTLHELISIPTGRAYG